MLRHSIWYWFIVYLGLFELASAACPSVCICDRDSNNRKRVRCDQGGLSIPAAFALQSIDKDVEVLLIAAPAGKPNSVSGLEPNMFKDLQLKELYLTNSQLESIGHRTFYYLSSTLQVLNLANNNIMDINENNFRNLSVLTHLHLDHNKISHLHSAVFNYQRSLKVLTVSNNRITDLGTRFLLQELPVLEVLDISGNPIGGKKIDPHIESIPELIFQDVPNLRKVSLANTNIEKIPFSAVAKYCRNLEDLDVSNNKITTISDKQFNLIKSLRRLNLAGNQLTSIIPGSFSGLKLDHLDLSNINSNLFRENSTRALFQNSEVKSLSLASNGLQEVDQQLLTPIATDLIAIDLGGNPINLRDRMFQFLPNLQSLSLSSMRLPRLPSKLLDYNHKVIALNISSNLFAAIDEKVFQSAPKLEVLDFSNNKIQAVPYLVSQLPLRELHANDNLLKNLPDHLLDSFQADGSPIKTVRIHGNPLQCDYMVAALSNWVSSTAGRKIVCGEDAGYRCPVCAAPSGVEGTPVDEIKVLVSKA
ncbi:hypothetical protein RvY_01333 [Ramazzottius varieornatus]|uniref:LRRCT domain-containing protein n=1 Tax=Ramazzottius varieornatus TaxID=947166 RepID=A0A1D1UQN1_RAMVA|nr:hypothetical protein RvY_01333 [Ramazzottius varieornatus]